MKNKPFSIRERIKSFSYAFNGLRLFFISEHNGRIHLVAAVVAIALSFYLHLSTFEWIAILSVIAAVLIAEILNTSVEKLADLVSTDIHPKIKIVKDLAAAAVLIAVILALAVGCFIFIPKLF
ncbi:diacylglycerol kinase family protein [Pedobacter punctiformis]|uniref:Diacylglycerol kinase family protein n=1 Tax=Pedobacter punctiformis TaxID=3004097 RepID=A0ABT4LDJ0_9SPHI|nr:diacylglycerol kinase family protein [Pedobacter sp. HCMS5-2]MCZ4245807.1 diacylglycerol kinase family protein [Pedobacter sp. HCMS5-2]